MKTLLIGDGYWGNIIKPKLEKFTDLVLVANSKTDLDDVFMNNQIDYVFVCSSTKSHYDIVRKCIKYEKDIFCEKPFTGDFEKSKDLYKLADENRVNIYVDNIFLHRKEFIDFKKRKFTNIQFLWNKKDSNYKEDICDSLLYHDIYLLVELTNSDWLIVNKTINDQNLYVEMINDNMRATFKYDRDFNGKEKKIIVDDDVIDFSNPINDPLEEIIKEIVNSGVNYAYNRELTLSTLKLLSDIKK